jgi:hypothetical protein
MPRRGRLVTSRSVRIVERRQYLACDEGRQRPAPIAAANAGSRARCAGGTGSAAHPWRSTTELSPAEVLNAFSDGRGLFPREERLVDLLLDLVVPIELRVLASTCGTRRPRYGSCVYCAS